MLSVSAPFSSVSVSQPARSTSTVTSPKEVKLLAVAEPSRTRSDDITKAFDNLRGERYAVVLAGFSGLGYEHPAAVRQKITELLNEAIKNHKEGVALVIGGTTDGIGMGYAVAKDDPHFSDVKLIGLVSEVVKEQCPHSLAKECGDNIIFVSDPDNTWEVLNQEGSHSYTAYAAEKHGEFNILGGGAVAQKEVECAKNQGVSPMLFQFAPDPEQLQKKLEQGKTRETLMPLDAFF